MTAHTGRTVEMPVDGGAVPAYVAEPASPGPGVVLFQELLGVNDYIRDVADRLAAAGYLTAAPVLYWRLDGKIEFNREEEFGEAFGLAARFDTDQAMDDAAAVLRWLRSNAATGAGVGAVGFCMGGGLVYRFAAAADPDCAVSYYGPQVVGDLDHAGDIDCPVLFHFGRTDPMIPLDGVAAVEEAFAARDDVDVHLHDAGHAFDNHHAPSMHDPTAAARAWEQTMAFLDRHLRERPADAR